MKQTTSCIRYVVGFLFVENDVLLLRKARPSWQAGKLNGVGGHVEEGESFLEAMRREFLEETRVRGLVWEQFMLYAGVEDDSKVGATGGEGARYEIGFFRAELRSKPEVQGEPDEPLEWTPVTAVPHALTLPNLKWVVPMAFAAQRKDWPFYIREKAGSLV